MSTRKVKVDGETENVNVFIRVRPLTKEEIHKDCKNIIHIDREESSITLIKPGGNKPKSFTFDYIFSEESTQKDLYRHVALPVVDKVLEGYNGTILVYGQTGTGKTYTMTGIQKTDARKGIIPNAFSHIFTEIGSSSGQKCFVATVTYLQIYNEDVHDLLSPYPNKKLQVRNRIDIGVYVKDLMGFTVESIESLSELMNKGNKNRVTRSTEMNDVSSRSHAIFTIRIESKNGPGKKTTTGKLNLVDLAGSERTGRTQATGDRLREASSINQSLSVLGNVITALVEGKSLHIPYRNSKLTRLLQDSLGGNSKTVMIAMVSPSDKDYEESICTLRYASRVKYIKNHFYVNVESQDGLIECFEKEIADLQQKLSSISLHKEKVIKKKKNKIASKEQHQLKKMDEELEIIKNKKILLTDKINSIQKKILVGGENLYLKAQEQEFLLQKSELEIEKLDRKHHELEETLQKKGSERIDIEEKYSSLQEENVDITKKIETILVLLNEENEKYEDKKQEYAVEIECLLNNNKLLNKELQLANMMINHYIPKEYQKHIEANIQFDTETREYQLGGIAYTGNNMRELTSASSKMASRKCKIKNPYLSYRQIKKQTSQTLYASLPTKSNVLGNRSDSRLFSRSSNASTSTGADWKLHQRESLRKKSLREQLDCTSPPSNLDWSSSSLEEQPDWIRTSPGRSLVWTSSPPQRFSATPPSLRLKEWVPRPPPKPPGWTTSSPSRPSQWMSPQLLKELRCVSSSHVPDPNLTSFQCNITAASQIRRNDLLQLRPKDSGYVSSVSRGRRLEDNEHCQKPDD